MLAVDSRSQLQRQNKIIIVNSKCTLRVNNDVFATTTRPQKDAEEGVYPCKVGINHLTYYIWIKTLSTNRLLFISCYFCCVANFTANVYMMASTHDKYQFRISKS